MSVYSSAMGRMTRNVARVYTGSETRTLDRRAIREFGIPGIRLMHRAGRAAFAALRRRWPDAGRISVVCGAGNNAGDGYVVAGLAKDAGLEADVVQIGDPAKLRGDALAALRFAECRLGAIHRAAPAAALDGDLVVDALLGTGASGAVREPYAAAIRRINASGKPVLALDVPSGIDADSGALMTAQPVRADLTVTFVAAKLGLLTGDAVDFAGDVEVDRLDLPAAVYDKLGIAVLAGSDLQELIRRPGAHKGDSGRLLVIGGEADMGGAVALAGEAALRTGAGLVGIATRGVNRAAILARRPELMVRECETPGDIADLVERADAIAVGPGLGRSDWGRELLGAAINAGKPMVADADALNIVADTGCTLPQGAIITPHPGEAGRMLGSDAAWVQSHRAEAAATLSGQGAVAVLKGAGTLIADAGEVRAICVDGNPALATAGSGDVLTGVIGALLARGMVARAAAELGVWLHARAGDEAAAECRASPVAGDFIDALRLTP